jgi:olefin beta-lactone synthetase
VRPPPGEGVRRGDRALVMVRPGLPLIAAAFALFKIGAVPVIIDPGMGLRNSSPASRARGRAPSSGSRSPRSSRGVPAGVPHRRGPRSRERLAHGPDRGPAPPAERLRPPRPATWRRSSSRRARPAPRRACATSTACSTPRSASSGRPTASSRGGRPAAPSHLRPLQPGARDDERHPGDRPPPPGQGGPGEDRPGHPPGGRHQFIRIADALGEGRRILPRDGGSSCRACGGSSAPGRRCPPTSGRRRGRSCTNGRLHSPYGATEALPVSTVSADEIDAGSTPGRLRRPPRPGDRGEDHPLSDGPVASLGTGGRLPAGSSGEIIVRGPGRHPGIRRASRRPPRPPRSRPGVRAASGTGWATAGRSTRRGGSGSSAARPSASRPRDGTLFTEPCEQVFRAHPRAGAARWSAWGRARAGRRDADPRGGGRAQLAAELRALALRHPTPRHQGPSFPRRLPVDVRHNAKIHRLALARWAASARAYTAPEWPRGPPDMNEADRIPEGAGARHRGHRDFLGRGSSIACSRRAAPVAVAGRTPAPDLEARGVRFIRADLEDARAVGRRAPGCETVFHVAAKVGVWGRYADFFRANVLGTRAVIEGCRARRAPARLHEHAERRLQRPRPGRRRRVAPPDDALPEPVPPDEGRGRGRGARGPFARAGDGGAAAAPHLGPGRPPPRAADPGPGARGRLRIVGEGRTGSTWSTSRTPRTPTSRRSRARPAAPPPGGRPISSRTASPSSSGTGSTRCWPRWASRG